MDLVLILSIIFAVLSIIFITASMTIMIFIMFKFHKMKSIIDHIELENNNSIIENKRKDIEYTNSILNFIRDTVDYISILKFQQFKDGRDMSKITKMNIEHLIEDIARTVNDSISKENIMSDRLLLTEDYINKYIVEITIYTVKKILSESIDNVDIM